MAIRKKREILIFGTGRLALFSLAFFGNGRGNACGYIQDEEECKRINALLKNLDDTDLKKALLRKKLFFVSSHERLVESNILVLAFEKVLESDEKLFSLLEAVLKDNVNEEITIVIRSLSRPGTAKKIRDFCEKEFGNKKFFVISIPDLSDPESGYSEERNPYRVIVGSKPDENKLIISYYNELRSKGAPIYEVSNEEAEIASLASKMYLAQKAAFGSSLLSEANKEGARIDYLVELLGSDPRISRRGLNPKDLFDYADVSTFEGMMPEISGLIEEKRKEIAEGLTSLIKELLGSLKHKKIAVVGLGKAGLVDSWSQRVYDLLKNEKTDLMFFDFSLAKEKEFSSRNPEAKVSKDFFECVEGADALIIFDGSPKLKKLVESDLVTRMRGRIIFDYAKAININQYIFFDVYRFGVLVKRRLSEKK